MSISSLLYLEKIGFQSSLVVACFAADQCAPGETGSHCWAPTSDACTEYNIYDADQAYFCDAPGDGYYFCLGGVFVSQSTHMVCPPGTVCRCPVGAVCDSGLTQSPCDFP